MYIRFKLTADRARLTKKMSETTTFKKEIRWRNGFWSNDKMPSTIVIIDGDKVVSKPIIALDYPDIGVDNQVWLPDGCSQIFRIVCVWPFRLLDYGSATLRCKI